MEVKIKRTLPDAVIPAKAHKEDAGFDLYAASVERTAYDEIVCHTGLAFEIPDGHVGLLFPRSSIAGKPLLLKNSVGVIDSGYRGEVTFKFRQVENGDIYRRGDRIGQIIIIPYPEVEFIECDELSSSGRGQGGYGSTGR